MYGRFLVLFALMATGYILSKKKVFDSNSTYAINKFIVYFAYPCMVVQKISALEMEKITFINFMITFILSTLLLYVGYGISYIYGKVRRFPRENANVAEFAMASPNDGFMGLPVALLFFGDMGLLFMLAHNSALNLYLFTLGISMMKRNKEDKQGITIDSVVKAVANLIMNPNILALIAGLLLCGSGVKLPVPLNDYFLYVGNVATPMAMIYIGTSLAKSNFVEIIKDKKIMECCLMKLVWLPLMTSVIMLFLPVSDIIKITCILGCCFPTAPRVPMLAEQERQDSRLGSEILFLSTAFSALTIPLTIQLINMFITN
nr:AEC family transporter [uncultured Aminipila sp.]